MHSCSDTKNARRKIAPVIYLQPIKYLIKSSGSTSRGTIYKIALHSPNARVHCPWRVVEVRLGYVSLG